MKDILGWIRQWFERNKKSETKSKIKVIHKNQQKEENLAIVVSYNYLSMVQNKN